MFNNFICPNIVWFWKSGYLRSILKHFYSFPVAELHSIESEDEFFPQEFSDKDSNYGDSDDEDI